MYAQLNWLYCQMTPCNITNTSGVPPTSPWNMCSFQAKTPVNVLLLCSSQDNRIQPLDKQLTGTGVLVMVKD